MQCPFRQALELLPAQGIQGCILSLFKVSAFKMVAASHLKFMGTDGWISETGVTSYRVFFTTCLASFPPKKKPDLCENPPNMPGQI